MFTFSRISSQLFKWQKDVNQLVVYRKFSFKTLHPFYLAVHPDLFNGYPVEQKTNEESLKIVHSYLNGLENRSPVYSTTVTFFKKDRDKSGKDVISQVQVHLSHKSMSATVKEIMKACNLSHHGVDQETEKKYRGWEDSLETFGKGKEEFAPFMGNLNVGIFGSVSKLTLDSWLTENEEKVQGYRKKAKPFITGINAALKELKGKYGVAGFSNDSLQYSFSMVYAGMKQLHVLLDRYFAGSDVLRDRLVKFGHFNGVDQLGRVLLNMNDLPSDWKMGLSMVVDNTSLIHEIKAVEKSLQQCCCGLRFIRPRGSYSYPVQLYLKGLQNVHVSLCKEAERGPTSYKGIYAICDWDGDFVGISLEGYVKVPIHTNRRALLSFIERNSIKIKNKRKDYLRSLQRQQSAMSSCKSKLGLDSLDKDFTINTTQTVEACDKLEACDVSSHVMRDWSVVLSNYYSVSADGLVRIPWNFERKYS